MSFCIYKTCVALCNNERVVLYNLEDDTTTTILLPELPTEKKTDLHNNTEIESFHTLTTVDFSNDGKYFVVCTNRKQLCLYEKTGLKLLSSRVMTRAASRVRFTPSNDIIVADKTGDVYLYSTADPSEKGTLLLGHLSMLLDVWISQDEKYIVTTDRDEKIRVSMFPNSYNIVCYCLGHTKFVTNVSELPISQGTLVSAGGDGTIKLWDYVLGKELMSINFFDRIPKNYIEKFNKQLEDCHLDEPVKIIPVKHLRLFVMDGLCLIILSFYSIPVLLVYRLKGNRNTNFNAEFVQSLTVQTEPVECTVCGNTLWILTNSAFEVFAYTDNHFNMDNTLELKLKELDSLWQTLQVNAPKQDLFPILYKRRFDNVQEYLERKKVRLGNVIE